MDHIEAGRILQVAGGPFELGTDIVNGREVTCFKTREHSMREKVAASAVHGAKEFLVYENQRITFAEFVELTWGASHALLDGFGLKKRDRVGILAYNRPEWLIALFGAASAGGICVGLNGWWTSDEILYALTDSSCRYLIVDELLWHRIEPLIRSAGRCFAGRTGPVLANWRSN